MNTRSFVASMVLVSLYTSVVTAADNASFIRNPAVSVILDLKFSKYNENRDNYELPGLMLGGESELADDNLTLGHAELIGSAEFGDWLYGQTTLAMHEHEGNLEWELEEMYLQTIGLGNGFTFKAGRFFSGLGYLNEQHEHAWDFSDAPLVYRGFFGNQMIDDGLQMTWLAPTDMYMQFGAEIFTGRHFSVGGNNGGGLPWNVFFEIGDDIGVEHSWKLGLSHYNADDIDGREGGGHAHGGGADEIPSFHGESEISAIDFVYKWAPDGNARERHFKFQAEYFYRDEEGLVTLLGSSPLEQTSYDGEQEGWYAQAVYQFMPQWLAGLRYDSLGIDNTGADADVMEEAGLLDEGHSPSRISAMLEWRISELRRLRMQVNRDRSYAETDTQIFLQYTHSFGQHGAHQY